MIREHYKRILAHRGNITRTGAPEDHIKDNTEPAFREAFTLPGLGGIEFDIDQTADGCIVLYNRTIEERKADFDLQELKKNHPDFLALTNGLVVIENLFLNSPKDDFVLNMEIKRYDDLPYDRDVSYSTDYEERVIEEIRKCIGTRPLVITSFSPMALIKIRSLCKTVRLGLLCGVQTPEETQKAMKQCKPDFLAPISKILADKNWRSFITDAAKENWIWLVGYEGKDDSVKYSDVLKDDLAHVLIADDSKRILNEIRRKAI